MSRRGHSASRRFRRVVRLLTSRRETCTWDSPSRAPIWVWVRSPDALLTSWMALPVDPTLALGTLQTLARYQGSREYPLTEEQPGRILHEVRLGAEGALALGGGRAYYGTADATPLFVALLGELHRCGLPETEVAAFLPAADRALEWIDTTATRMATVSLSIGGPPTAAWSTRAGRTPSTGSTGADGPWPCRPSRSPRCRPMCTRHTRPAWSWPTRCGDQARAPALAEAGGGPQGGVQRAVLDADCGRPTRSPWTGAGTRSTSSPRTWATVCGAASSTRPGRRRSPGTWSGRGCGPVSACARWPTTWAPTTR